MFVQQARALFKIEVRGLYHCGPNHDSPKTFPYEVALHYDDSALDDKGFLLDNTYFQQYFDSLRETDLSCERLAKRAAEELLAASNGRARRARVSIEPIPGVRVVFLARAPRA